MDHEGVAFMETVFKYFWTEVFVDYVNNKPKKRKLRWDKNSKHLIVMQDAIIEELWIYLLC